jgi:hypothetical protein
MARKSRLARHRQRNNLLLGVMALVLVSSVMGAAAWWWRQRQPTLDAASLCPLSGPIGHTILLVDKTDPLNLAQKAAFDLLISDLVEHKTPKGYLLSIFVLGDDFKANTQPLVELCNPGDDAGHSDLTENTKQFRRQYKEKFIQPVRNQTEQLLGIAPANESPILEMLQMVSLTSLQKHHVDGPKKLIVMTDLMQNSKQLSLYKGVPDFERFSDTAFAQKTKILFQDVEVRIDLLQNAPALQKQNLLTFWQMYFKKAGAASVDIVPLPG